MTYVPLQANVTAARGSQRHPPTRDSSRPWVGWGTLKPSTPSNVNSALFCRTYSAFLFHSLDYLVFHL